MLDITMVNPVNEQSPLAQLLIVVLVCLGVTFVAAKFSAGLVEGFAVLAGLALPASVSGT